jgi:hypothetical protein
MEGILMKKIGGFILCLAMLIPLVIAAPVLAAPNENAWRTVPASMVSNTPVTYSELTDYCINTWGLSNNPYPDYGLNINNQKYYIFTLQIGDDVYQGISCNSLSYAYNPTTHVLTITYNAIWYLGDWGKTNARMNQGFAGTAIVDCINYNPIAKTYSYYTGTWTLDGFQRFNHQSIELTQDTRVPGLPSGICIALGNRDKM